MEATLLMGGNKTRNYELRRIEKSVEKVSGMIACCPNYQGRY